MDVKIQDLFYYDIKRDLDGVIKVDQDDDKKAFTELDEYVVTRESLKYIDTFFQKYLRSTETITDKIGVWVSGDFGSGKSHFLKILSYLLNNRQAGDKTALEFFESKISDPDVLNTIEKSVKFGTKDVILFNIDSKSGETSERIVDIMMRVFNEKRGYFGDVFWIAEMEENLEDKGLYTSFKDAFLEINGKKWEEVRDQYSFEQDDIIEALCRCDFQSREASERLFESDGKNHILTPEKFAKAVEKYCRSKGKNHQVIFLIDEIGQYIGDNSSLMLNLQTVAEELGTILKGKAWIIVTSQADIETALRVMKGKEIKQDFSKIQARFDTRVSLSSANVDEVIKKRILKKKDEYQDLLSGFYDENKIILKNLISFSQGSAEMKNYKDTEDFASVYPFVPYQFNVLQKVFEKIRSTGFTGKHLAKGERSMLNAYKESAERYGGSNLGALVPFHSFYDTIESFLDPVIKRTISQAGDNGNLEGLDCLILKTLFMIRHVKELQPTLDNIVVLSLTNVEEDKLRLRENVVASLNRLEKETLISKSGDTFHFLTNEEQEINREIKNIEVDKHRIIQVIYDEVFTKPTICQKSYGEYKFNRAVDGKLSTSPDADLTIKFLTPYSDEYFRGSEQQSFDGANLSNVDSKDTLLFIFPNDSEFITQIESYLQIELYLKQNSSNRNDETMQGLLVAKGQEVNKLKDSSIIAICEGVKNAKVFIDGVGVAIDSGSPKERVQEGFDKLVENVYNKSHYVTKDFESDSEILRLLKVNDLEQYGLGRSERNKLALDEMLAYIRVKDEKKINVVFGDLRTQFMKKPYGWKGITISGLVATLYMNEELKLRYQMTYLFSNPEEITKYLTRKEDFDKIVVEVWKRTDIEVIANVKSVLRDVFDKTALPEKENDIFKQTKEVFENQKGILTAVFKQYSEGIKYPGKREIENYLDLLKGILEISDPSAFLRKISDKKDEIFRLHKEAELPLAFFEGSQKNIFKNISGEIENYTRNAQFLDDKAIENLSDIKRILGSEKPYFEIKNLSSLEAAIKASLAKSLTALKEESKGDAELYKQKLYDGFRYSDGFTDGIWGHVEDEFNSYVRKVDGSNDCSFVKLQGGNLPSIYKKIYSQTEERLKPKPEIIKGVQPKSEIKVEIIDKTPLFRTTKTIETEEDLNEYIRELKEKLTEILKSKKIQVI